MYIAIAGNIGSGKTTLTKMLAKHYGWKKYLEPVADNPYIDDYYKDIPRWALNMEVFYLKQRFKNLLEIQHSTETVIQDRTIFEGVYVFAANNRRMGNMDQRDYETYMELFESMMEVVEMPETHDLSPFLSSLILSRISRSGDATMNRRCLSIIWKVSTIFTKISS